MIKHFLFRDIKTYRLIILMMLFVFPLGVFITLIHGVAFIHIIFSASLLFIVIPMNSIIGSHFRNQHEMSRNYILALPANRSSLFSVMFVRLGFFWIPMFLMICLLPLIFHETKESFNFSFLKYVYYLLTVFVGLFLNCISMVYFGLKMQKTSSNVERWHRFLSHTISFVIYMMCAAITFAAVSAFFDSYYIFSLPILLILTFIFRIKLKQLWMFN